MLSLNNVGGAPARDVEVTLQFPKGIVIIADRDLQSVPHIPLAPTIDNFQGLGVRGIYDKDDYIPDAPDEIRVDKIMNLESGGIALLKTTTLKHTEGKLVSLNLHFPADQAVHPFQLQYTIWMSNYPALVEGTLNIRVYSKGL